MKVKLNKSVNIFGLEWPAGEYEVQDQFWAKALMHAQAVQEAQAPELATTVEQTKARKKRGE